MGIYCYKKCKCMVTTLLIPLTKLVYSSFAKYIHSKYGVKVGGYNSKWQCIHQLVSPFSPNCLKQKFVIWKVMKQENELVHVWQCTLSVYTGGRLHFAGHFNCLHKLLFFLKRCSTARYLLSNTLNDDYNAVTVVFLAVS